jgi:thiamine-monophosphate kinase
VTVVNEFDLIEKYFMPLCAVRQGVDIGIGDDCAVLSIPEGYQLAVSTDTLVAGVHFFSDADATDVGYKSLAVSLSDLAAMGASPAWFTLCLTLPELNENWLEKFVTGLSNIARSHNIPLVGGDTTKGPLSITIQAQGFLPSGQCLSRYGAKPDDHVFVTGELGEAAYCVKQRLGNLKVSNPAKINPIRLHRPIPRVSFGQAILSIANSAIDLSDGLLADLGHILHRSHVGGEIQIDHIPVSKKISAYLAETDDWSVVLAGGDDYELCFTVAPNKLNELYEIAKQPSVKITEIGRITEQQDQLACYRGDQLWKENMTGYGHF